MSTSPARIAANQRNASKSTGPRTPEGKAASRMNAFQHGLAGEGDLLAPGEDAGLIARRTRAFASELGAVGETGHLMAHRAALLSIRMERSAQRESTAVAANMADARAQFDQSRLNEIDGWIEKLDDPAAFRPALEVLETSPEGLAHLMATWENLLDQIQPADGFDSKGATRTAMLWLDLGDPEVDALGAGLAGKIVDELSRLRLRAESMPPVRRAIEAQRDRAAILASFDPSPQASLARRYEAAAERGMYRAIRAIAEIRRGQEVDVAAVLLDAPLRPAATPSPRPAPTASPAPLGSFRATVPTAPSLPSPSVSDPVRPAISPEEHRKKRPDLRKLLQNRR